MDNIGHILRWGITHSASVNANANYCTIGDARLIKRRSEFLLKNGRKLGEYIPFYFWGRMPMLYVIQKGYNMVAPTHPAEIVYCISSVQKIIDQNLDFLFTNGHAVDKFTTYFSATHLETLGEILDFQAIKAKYWKSDTDLDLKRRKEAEFLILGDILPETILGYIVYNEGAKAKFLLQGAEAEIVEVRREFYF